MAFAIGAMFETKPMRLLLRLGKAPTSILAATGMLTEMMLDTGRRQIFGSRQPNFVTHANQ